MRLTPAEGAASFSLKVVPPFRLDLTAWALRRRPENKMDRWDGKTFRRALVLNGKPAELIITQLHRMTTIMTGYQDNVVVRPDRERTGRGNVVEDDWITYPKITDG